MSRTRKKKKAPDSRSQLELEVIDAVCRELGHIILAVWYEHDGKAGPARRLWIPHRNQVLWTLQA